MKRILGIATLFFIPPFPLPLFAENVKPLIIYAEGSGFPLIRDGKAEFIDFSKQKPIGFELKKGDIVNLEAKTTFEIQLFPTMTVIKISESSSFAVKAVYENGSYDIEVMYGRLRTKIDEKKASAAFIIDGVDIASRKSGTDFGYDKVFSPEKALAPAVYCFQGALEVSGRGALAGALAATNMEIDLQEQVTITRAGNGDID